MRATIRVSDVSWSIITEHGGCVADGVMLTPMRRKADRKAWARVVLARHVPTQHHAQVEVWVE